MSSRGKNHTRGTMRAWRGMAAEGYPGHDSERGTRAHPRVLRRNSRWRPIVRLLAKQAGWTLADGFLHTYFRDLLNPRMRNVLSERLTLPRQ